MPTTPIPVTGDAGSAHISEAQPQAPVQEQAVRTNQLLKVYPGLPPLPTLPKPDAPGTLPLENIQGDIFTGKRKERELFYFFHINDAPAFKKALKDDIVQHVTSTRTIFGPPESQPSAFLNIGFSATGLAALGITDNIGTSFAGGQHADAPALGDNVAIWEPVFAGTNIHGIFLIGSDEEVHINCLLGIVTSRFGGSITKLTTLQGVARPGAEAGHEHFGFLDGISNPTVTGLTAKDHVLPGQSLIPPGIILAGRDGDTEVGKPTRPAWTLDGSFLVFRKLQQFVPEFDQFRIDNAVRLPGLTVSEGAELLGARMIGRWKSGAPIDLSPLKDDPELGKDPQRNNNFDFSHPGEDIESDQTRCPFSAHIRKTRPRADLQNANTVNQAIRGGIPYGPEVTPSEHATHRTTHERGLAFVEYQSQIDNGFRFQQVTWANNSKFIFGKNVQPGFDPIIGQDATNFQTVETVGLDPNAPTAELSVPRFIKSLGGEYFFSPSISALKDTISA